MRATIYRVDGENQAFKTLREAKWHVHFAYTNNERIRWFGKEPSYIYGINKASEEVVSLIEIRVDENGRETFGRAIKY